MRQIFWQVKQKNNTYNKSQTKQTPSPPQKKKKKKKKKETQHAVLGGPTFDHIFSHTLSEFSPKMLFEFAQISPELVLDYHGGREGLSYGLNNSSTFFTGCYFMVYSDFQVQYIHRHFENGKIYQFER